MPDEDADTIKWPEFLGSSQELSVKEKLAYDGFYVNKEIVEKVVSLGYPESFVTKSLSAMESNHATATYSLLLKASNA